MTLKSAYRMITAWRQRVGLAVPGEQTPPLPAGPPVVPWYNAGGAPNPVDAWDAEGAGNYATSLIGLVAATVLGEIGGGPVNWGPAGWSGFNALNRCLDMGLLPDNTQAGMTIIKYTGLVGTNDFPFGAATGANYYGPYQVFGAGRYYDGSAPSVVLPFPAAGILAIATGQGYRNGAPDGAACAGWGGNPSTSTIYIGACNEAGVANYFFSGTIAKIGRWAIAPTALQIAAIVAAM